ncbi:MULTISPECIES: hypothetical protein [Alphaproteobacteria]|uniref:hypothetical protein n=1 Tax=Alphaproteobacteria TaxID=28211 RepID=UPI00329A5A4C
MKHDEHPGEHHAPHASVSRRTLLVLAGTAIIAAAIPSALFLREPGTASGHAADFVRLLADPKSAAHIGEIWFEKAAPGQILAVYEARLSRKLKSYGWHEGMDAPETHRVLAETVRADYAADRMVSVGDWQLSETEADLAALAALALRDPSHAPSHDGEAEEAGTEDAHG